MARAYASLGPTLIALGVAAVLSSPGTAHAQSKIHSFSPGLNNIAISVFDFSIRGTIPFPGGPKPEITLAVGAHYPQTYGEPSRCEM